MIQIGGIMTIVKTLLIASAFFANTITPRAPEKSYDFTKNYDANKPTVFLWDLHDVLLKKRSFFKRFKAILKTSHKVKMLAKLDKQQNKAIWAVIKDPSKTQDLLDTALRQNNKCLAQLILNVAEQYDVMPGMSAVIKELASAGHIHYVGSNIAEHSFRNLYKRSDLHQALFQHFDIQYPQIIGSSPGLSHTKPSIEFFRVFLQRNDIDLAHMNVIFIDDRMENVIAAQKTGLVGIHFKNVRQLKTDLTKLNITAQQQTTVPA